MATARSELDLELAELEVRLERLRSLYEQYFIGLEKLEPTIPRQDVDRRIKALRKARIRNTARRYKFQTLIQRYNSFQQYWTRVCREMENGTYHRHIARAKKRFGDVPLTAAGRKRARGPKESQPPEGQQERAKRQAEDDLDALLREDPEEAMRRALAEAADSVQPRPRPSEVETPTDPLPPPRHSTDPVSSSSRTGSDASMTIPAAPPEQGPPSEPKMVRAAKPPNISKPPPRRPKPPAALGEEQAQAKTEQVSSDARPARSRGEAVVGKKSEGASPERHQAGATAKSAGVEAAVAAQRAQPVVVRASKESSVASTRSTAESRPNSWPVLRPSSPTSSEGGKEVGMGRASSPPVAPSRRRDQPFPAAGDPRAVPAPHPPVIARSQTDTRSAQARQAPVQTPAGAAPPAPAPKLAPRVSEAIPKGAATPAHAPPGKATGGQASRPAAGTSKPSARGDWSAARAQAAAKEEERALRARVPNKPEPDRWAAAKERAERKQNAPNVPPTAATAAGAPTGLTNARISELHAALISERKRLGQTGRVSLDSLEKTMRATESKLRSQYAGKPVDFQVVVKNGKAIVKPIVG